MIAVCLDYIWVVLLGEYALNKGINRIFHRTDRCDLSFLQLGFRYIEHLINNNAKFPYSLLYEKTLAVALANKRPDVFNRVYSSDKVGEIMCVLIKTVLIARSCHDAAGY